MVRIRSPKEHGLILENAKKFLEELDTNEMAQELLKSAEPGISLDEAPALAEAARATGYDVSDEEMQEFLVKVQEAQAAASDAVADQIRDLDDSELDSVAGGKGCARCHTTYEDDENCVFNELCNKLITFHYNTEEPPRTCSKNTFCDGFMLKPGMY